MFLRPLALIALIAVSNAAADTTPRYVIFTYAGAPSTTLTVNWQTTGKTSWTPSISYSTSPRKGLSSKDPAVVHGDTSQIEGLDERFIHRVQLTGLQPNTTYYLNINGDDGKPQQGSPEFKIRTIPDDETPLRFVTGGDMGTSESVRLLLKNAASYDPDFAVVGGDVAYANGQLKNLKKWDTWLEYYTEEMQTSDGYSIPIVLAVGNHETNGGFDKTPDDAPFFRGFFGQDPEKNYFSRRFGKNLILLALDSGHTTSHESQADWIRTELKKHAEVPYTAAVYHVPLFPSHRDFMGHHSEEGRKHWAPVFDEMGLTVAFENHDHTYKRSHLIKDGEVTSDGTGTLYLGDGCWGRGPRPAHYEGELWYLRHSGSIQHFWIVDVAASGMVYRAVNIKNQVFDVYPENHPESAAATAVRETGEELFIFPKSYAQTPGYTVQGERWSGGPTTIEITNPFDQTLSYTLKPGGNHADVEMGGFSEETYTLKPAASNRHEVTFTPKSGNSLPLNQTGLSYTIQAELKPEDGPPVRFQSSFTIPVNVEE